MKNLSLVVDEETLEKIDELAEGFDSRSEAVRTLIKGEDEEGITYGEDLAEKRIKEEEKRRDQMVKLAPEWEKAGV